MTAAELAERAGTALERVTQLVGLGIVRAGADGSFRPGDIQRVRLADAFGSSGIPVEDIAAVMASGHVTRRPGRRLREPGLVPLEDVRGDSAGVRSLPGRAPASLRPTGPTPADGRRARSGGRRGDHPRDPRGVELPRPRPSARPHRPDGANLRREHPPPDGFARRVARGEGRRGDRAIGWAGVYRENLHKTVQVLEATERAVAWLFQRFVEHEIVEDIVNNVEDDLEAAELAAKLGREIARGHGGRPVKFLGDGVMFHFADPGGAVLAALELVERIPEAGLPPARIGIDAGPIVFRDGDYYGRAVNVAARIADHARPREVL